MKKHLILSLGVLLAVTGCSQAYYSFWEAMGSEKRDLLVSEVDKSRDSQEELQAQFASTLERIQTEYPFEAGQLEETYDMVGSDYKAATLRYEDVKKRNANVKEIAEDLFEEWETEAAEIRDAELRNQSLTQLEKSQASFATLSDQMDTMLESVEPVLAKLNDQRLSLKHSMNAQATGSLETSIKSLAPEIEGLKQSIQNSIEASNAFQAGLKGTPAT